MIWIVQRWQLTPRSASLSIVSGGRALLPVEVRNTTSDDGFAELAARVMVSRRAGSDAVGWVVVPGEPQLIEAGGHSQFLVLVEPPREVRNGRYAMELALTVDEPSREANVVATLPIFVGAEWRILFVNSLPSDTAFELTGAVTFEVVGPPGARFRVELEVAPDDDGGKFPTRFSIEPGSVDLPASGRGVVTVTVVAGDTSCDFHALLIDGGTNLVVARSEFVSPALGSIHEPDRLPPL